MAQRSTWLRTSALMGLGIWLLCRPGAGLLLVLTVLASLPWLSMRAWECLNDSSRRKTLWPSIAMTLLALAVPSAVHFHMATDARRHAQRLIDAVELHHQTYGSYPKDLQEIGIPAEQARAMFPRAHYSNYGGSPHVSYFSTFVAFDQHVYEFEHRTWVYEPD